MTSDLKLQVPPKNGAQRPLLREQGSIHCSRSKHSSLTELETVAIPRIRPRCGPVPRGLPLDFQDDQAACTNHGRGVHKLPLEHSVTADSIGRISDEILKPGESHEDQPIISRAQEFAIARSIQLERHRMRLALLSFDCVLQRVLQQLERIQRGEIRLDRYLSIPVADIEEKNRIRGLLASVTSETRHLREQNQSEFRCVINRRLSLESRRAIWRDVVQRKLRMARLLEQIKVRDSKLRELVPLLDSTHRRLTLRVVNNHAASSKTRASDVARLEMLYQADSLATFRRRLSIFNRHRKEYVRLSKLLASSHSRFVLHVARQYEGSGFGLADLIQEGHVGLLRAIERFDPQRGFRLITYAEWWIRQEIHNALLKTLGPVAIPRSLSITMRHFHAVVQSLYHVLGREPKLEEIAGCSGMTLEQARHIASLSSRHLSLHQGTALGEDYCLIDLIEDRDQSREERIESARSQLRQAMELLSPRERRIIQMRYGLTDGQPRTLAEVAKEYSLSRERVRQIEHEAVAKLRRDSIRNLLDGFLDTPASQTGVLRTQDWRE